MENQWKSPRPYTADQWEAQRSEITRLYVTEKRKLDEVAKIMAREHGLFAKYVLSRFGAAANQHVRAPHYKIRTSKWGLDKKVKADEMMFIVQKEYQRRVEEGKNTNFRLRGHNVNREKIHRFKKEHKISEHQIRRMNPSELLFPAFKA
jgi:tetrahydrodipicolinate N-succinyltransferase